MVPSLDRTCSTKVQWTLVLCCVAQLGLAPSARADESPRGFFGLTPVLTAEHVEVRAVTPGGPADEAGVRLGDVLLTLDGKPVPRGTQTNVVRAFTAFKEGEVVEIVLRSDGVLRKIQVTLAPIPATVREDQERIGEADQRIRAAEVVEEIFRAHDEIELSLSDEGALRFRGSEDSGWTVLEPQVARTFEPIAARFLRSGERKTVRLRVGREEAGSLALVPVD